MKRLFFFTVCFLVAWASFSQAVSTKLQTAYQLFLKDEQLKYALSSLYVIDAKTGKAVFDKNSRIGLAPASTQKIITSVTALELLGKEYRFKTAFGTIDRNGKKSFYIKPSCDPSFGSWRWESTKETNTLKRITAAAKNIQVNDPVVVIDMSGWAAGQVPDGWIWQDIGNYYGAGAMPFNWRENQYDLILKSGNSIGDAVTVVETKPVLYDYPIRSELRSAAKGTGDNAYIYIPVSSSHATVRGTIPVNESRFEISGAMINPARQFTASLYEMLKTQEDGRHSLLPVYESVPATQTPAIFYTEQSPSLDSLIYWFNKKSINLYGESLVKAIAFEKQGFGSTDSGLTILREFWEKLGLDDGELNMYDGSGLSPLNRVTTHAQVEILKYAKGRAWYPAFYDALPEFNGMKMKSGTISDVKGFCGYHKGKDGKEYIFSFLVNNYSGRSSTLVNKMYKVLDVLK